ncbi:MAG: Peptidyl-prolyl cis-trans isomerase C [Lentisphaerae bacterium ADurb.Bin242]|nr:MAG: Peptidyl-prolyl cis-trans isomerase C [Lentisphaerae bacterium ADurb.Bin242]
MIKRTTLIRATAFTAIAAFAFAGSIQLVGQDAKAKPAEKAPAAKAAAQDAAAAKTPAAPAAPKTLEEVFVFLPDPVATIGDKKITKKDFLDQLGKVPVEYLAQLQPEMLKVQSKQIIDALVEAEILLALSAKAGIKPSKEMVIAEFDKKLKALPKEQLDMIEKQLAVQNKKIDDIKNEMVKDPNSLKFYAINKWVEDFVKPRIKITDAAIEKFYRETPDQFKKPETISASHILISTMPDPNASVKPDAAALAKLDSEAKAKADKILVQLKQGADFGALAEKESACDSKKNKGSLGEFQRGQMVPEFEKAAFALAKPGDLSAVVKTQFGYHIIKLDSKTPASTVPLAQVKEDIRNTLTGKELQKEISAEVAKQKETMKVSVPAFK